MLVFDNGATGIVSFVLHAAEGAEAAIDRDDNLCRLSNASGEAFEEVFAHDGTGTLAVASAGVALYATGIVIWRGRQMRRAGGFRTRTAVALFVLGPTATLLFWANAFVFVSVAVYALALCVQLSVAVVSFYSLVSAADS